MKALKPINAGDEIFNDYGPLPRSDLLRRYGYITDNYAKYDVVEIPFPLIKEIASAAGLFLEDRLEYLDEHDVIETGYDIGASDPFTLLESLSPELIVLVETLLLPSDEFRCLKNKGKLPKPGTMTAKGAELLHKLVQARIQQYSTSVDEDINAAVDEPMTGQYNSKERRYAMAKTVRISEKNILREAEQALGQLARGGGNANGASKRQAEEQETGPGKKQRAK